MKQKLDLCACIPIKGLNGVTERSALSALESRQLVMLYTISLKMRIHMDEDIEIRIRFSQKCLEQSSIYLNEFTWSFICAA